MGIPPLLRRAPPLIAACAVAVASMTAAADSNLAAFAADSNAAMWLASITSSAGGDYSCRS